MTRRQVLAVVSATVGIFLAVQVGALALIAPLTDSGVVRPPDDPSNPTNSLFYIGVLLVATLVLLLALKYRGRRVVKAFILLSGGLISWYVFLVAIPPVLVVEGVHVLALLGAAAVVVALAFHPEWYVIDAAGVLMGMGGSALFGVTFGILPAIVLLGVLAVYDAISVYGTAHMLTLAEGVMAMKVPVVLVVPATLDYSFLEDEPMANPDADRGEADADGNPPDGENSHAEGADDRHVEGTDDGLAEWPNDGNVGGPNDENVEGTDDRHAEGPLERDALFIGLGDAVMPTVMVASAAFYSSAPSLGVPGLALNLPALTAMVGTMLGLFVLLWMVLKGRAHAGLPLLNGGAIGGYLVGALAAGVPLVEALGF